ncbi:MAG: hypothetical protein OXC91_05645, partial [Rhodobacteraceae bacterium]|nr:hypothetical protein [Paracoccaceae bacterium]
ISGMGTAQRQPDDLEAKVDAVAETLAKLIAEQQAAAGASDTPPSPSGTPSVSVATSNEVKLGPEHVPNNLKLYRDKEMGERQRQELHDFAKRVAAGETSIEEEMAYTKWFKEHFLPAQAAYRTNAPINYTQG